MLTDHTTASIIEAIISMTRILGLDVLAEGVEDQSQFAFLQQLGCDAVQGFYVSGAVPADEFAQLQRQIRQRLRAAAAADQGSARNLGDGSQADAITCALRDRRVDARGRRGLVLSNKARPPRTGFGRRNHSLRTVATERHESPICLIVKCLGRLSAAARKWCRCRGCGIRSYAAP